MARNPFIGPGIDQAWLEEQLFKAQRDLARGKATVGATSGEYSIRSEVEISLLTRIDLLKQALHRIDPENPNYAIADISPVPATKAVFS